MTTFLRKPEFNLLSSLSLSARQAFFLPQRFSTALTTLLVALMTFLPALDVASHRERMEGEDEVLLTMEGSLDMEWEIWMRSHSEVEWWWLSKSLAVFISVEGWEKFLWNWIATILEWKAHFRNRKVERQSGQIVRSRKDHGLKKYSQVKVQWRSLNTDPCSLAIAVKHWWFLQNLKMVRSSQKNLNEWRTYLPSRRIQL